MDRPVLIFFDQFENIFRDFDLIRSFRDLSAGVREIEGRICIGYAWKTDLVGWTEDHPYRQRDEIRDMATVFTVEPFGPGEVNTLLARLEKQATTRIVPDLKSRLREYSQGLPWLLKKLSDHVLRELNGGITQEQLIAEALNVQSLFESDLAELGPIEHEALHHVARFAPITASEVTERYSPGLVQSLVNRRLIVQVGEKLDTYWDIFRDFLNTGRIPVEDSYIIRQSTRSMTRLLPLVIAADGNASVSELAAALDTTDRSIYNSSRDLRLLGVTAYEQNRVRLTDEIWSASDREEALRRRVAISLRRHRAYTNFKALSERRGGRVTLSSYAEEIKRAFPAVEASASTWTNYARSALSWMLYAGIISERGNYYSLAAEDYIPTGLRLLDVRSPMRVRRTISDRPARPALELIKRVGGGEPVFLSKDRRERESIQTAMSIGAVGVSIDGKVYLLRQDLAPNGHISEPVLLSLLMSLPGGTAGIQALRDDPGIAPGPLGEILREASGANWSDGTAYGAGGKWRAWARAAGVNVSPVERRKVEG